MEAVIVGAARSPIGRAFKGSLIGTRPDDITTQIARAVLDGVPGFEPSDLDEIILGTSGGGAEQSGNLARAVAVALGLDGVPAHTVNRYCASSVQSTRAAFHAIKAGEGHAYLSLGVEMVSRVAHERLDEVAMRGPFFERRAENAPGWTDPRDRGLMPDLHVEMGVTAENVADIRGVSRREMDEFALRSQTLVAERDREGFWATDITPVVTPDGRTVSRDDSPRPTTTLDGLAALEPRFREGGSVTAGNSCPLNDGAAGVLVMSEERAKQLDLVPLARIVATGASALSPEIMGLGPVEASRRALAHAGMTIADIDQVEINEAFAAQVIPSYRELGADLDRVNVNGGAIALGHPYGMTGARITTTLLNSLRWHDQQFGLETMCVAGGQGMAIIFERLS